MFDCGVEDSARRDADAEAIEDCDRCEETEACELTQDGQPLRLLRAAIDGELGEVRSRGNDLPIIVPRVPPDDVNALSHLTIPERTNAASGHVDDVDANFRGRVRQ